VAQHPADREQVNPCIDHFRCCAVAQVVKLRLRMPGELARQVSSYQAEQGFIQGLRAFLVFMKGVHRHKSAKALGGNSGFTRRSRLHRLFQRMQSSSPEPFRLDRRPRVTSNCL